MPGPWEKYAQPAPSTAGPWAKYQGQQARPTDNYLSQGLSGFNEGVANILGFPVDAATMALNLGSAGINKAFGTELGQITAPIGGSDNLKATIFAPTISPESEDAGQQFVRRIGQEVGAMAIPGMGPIARSAAPARTLGAELIAAGGSGVGAAIAEQVAPDNELAEFAGQLVGGMAPGAIARMARKAPSPPSVDDLRAKKNAAYDRTKNIGVTYSPESYDDLLANIVTQARNDRISPSRHEKAYSFIRDMAQERGKPLTLTELDQLRQVVHRDLVKPSYRNPDMEADAHFGNIIIDSIDDMIEKASPSSMVSGDPRVAAKAIQDAREANKVFRKSEIVEEAIQKAFRRAESTGSGGNINNAIRQNIRSILDNPKKRRSFSKEEIDAMEGLVRQGKTENFLRLVGKLSPSGNGLMAMLGIGGTMINPMIGLASAAGFGAKALADKGTMDRARNLQSMLAKELQGVGAAIKPTKEKIDRQLALTLAQVANQNEPIDITVRGGAR